MNQCLHFSNNGNDLNTPSHIIKKVIDMWGSIDLDPCSNSKLSPNVPAKNHYTKDDNGLAQDWYGKVFVNPPYGNELLLWINKAIEAMKLK